MEVVASLSQGRTAAAQCGLFTHKSVPVIFEPPCILCFQKCLYFIKDKLSCCLYFLWSFLFLVLVLYKFLELNICFTLKISSCVSDSDVHGFNSPS